MEPLRGRPLPSLARAAGDLRAARLELVAGHHERDSVLEHRESVLALREALGVYILALERDDLPVARKLRQELLLLGLVDETSQRYRQSVLDDDT